MILRSSDADKIQLAIAILRMTHEPERDENHDREMLAFMSQQITAALEALEGRQ